jgi:two-component system, cell cycle sensor histidine kinase and response regulator CckA
MPDEKITNIFSRLIFGSFPESSLNRRLFLLILFVSILFAIIGNIANILLDLGFYLILATSIVILILTYYFFKLRKLENLERYESLPFILSIITFISLYLLNGGYDGNTLSLMIVYFVAIYTISSSGQKRRVFITYLVMIPFIILVQYIYPNVVFPYSDKLQRFIDVFVGNILYFLLLSYIVSTILKNYEFEHQTVLRINNTLHNLNEELKNKNEEILHNTQLLRNNEERLRLVLETTNDGIWDWEVGKSQSYFGPRYYTMLGYKPGEFTASFENWKKLVHPDDLPFVENIIEDESSKKDSYHFTEFRMKTKSGGWKWILNRYRIIERDKNGKPLRIIGVHSDITESKTAYEKLKESEFKYRTLIETSPDGIVTTNTAATITFMSEKALIMHGYDKLWEVVGRSVFEFFPEDEKQRAKESFLVFIKKNQLRNSIFKILKKNGDIFIAQINLNLIKTNTDEIAGVIGITRDITDYRKMEEQLQTRQRMDSIGTLAGGLAHDFNNLLTSITGYISLIEDDENLTDKQKKYLQKVLSSSMKAIDLSKQVQNLSKTDISELKPIDVYDVISKVFNLLEHSIDKIILKINLIKEEEYFVKGNPIDLQQVFLNLGTNAYQAFEERGIKNGDYIKVWAEENIIENQISELSDGEYIHIVFEDNGIGMSDEIKARAFDPLFTTKMNINKNAAHGLGLTTAYNIISRKHNGYINIESQSGKGTKVHIFLPKTHKISIEENTINNKKKTSENMILIIDDEAFIRDVASDILVRKGYKTISAVDGSEGLNFFNQKLNEIDLVLLDLTMPGMNGFTVMEEMVKIKPDVNILICSGHSPSADNGQSILSKAKGYIHKPFTAGELIETVEKII